MSNKVFSVVQRMIYATAIPLVSIIHVTLNTYRGNTNSVKTVLDDAIPMVNVFALPYLYWFAYVFFGLLFFAIVDYKYYFRLLFSMVMGMLSCFVVYYFFPTEVPRPDIYQQDIFSDLVRMIYSSDNPYNCFPSIHVLNALMVSIFLYKYSKGLGLKVISLVSFASITLSTMFIKQHYAMDAVASIFIGFVMYFIFTNDYIWRLEFVRKVVNLIIPERVKGNFAK